MNLQATATAIAGAACAILLAVTACGTQPAPSARQAGNVQPASGASASPSPIVIEQSSADGSDMTFTPTPGASAPLTADQAWADQATDGSTTVPDDVTAQLGDFTMPVGPVGVPGSENMTQANGEVYRALNQQAWAFTAHECLAPKMPAPGPDASDSQAPAPTPSDCMVWIVVDATTGKIIAITSQQH